MELQRHVVCKPFLPRTTEPKLRSPNRFQLVAFLISVCSIITVHGQTLNTTTTLAAETGNNTSTADTFATQTNGNIGATNISKVPLSTLLYGGNTTRIYVHFMPWFGGANHMNVGYASNDAAQVHRQVDDMMSRGAQGAIVDWYGPNHTREDQTTQYLRAEAETRGGKFEFAVMEDKGALSCSDTASCTSALLSDISYANATYFSSSAYMRVSGRPVLFFFGVESLPMDWTAVRQGALGNPLFIFENSMTRAEDDGGFTWVHGIDSFYQTALQYPGKQMFGSAAKGFNDTLAAWTLNRITPQNCGQFWLSTWAFGTQYWSVGDQLPALQVVTWNDYEEGTEIESGIDNCVSVAAALSGTSSLWWSITGSESTIDHYTVFASVDGQNLAKVADVAAGTHAFDLSTTNLPAGSYTLFVQAVGRPSLTNKISWGVPYTAGASSSSGGSGAGGGSGSPDIVLALASSTLAIPQGHAGSTSLSVTPQSGFQGAVTFSCSNLPSNAQCSFAPASLNVNGTAVATTVSISTGADTIGSARTAPDNPLFRWFGFGSPAFGLAGFVLTGRMRHKALIGASVACIALIVVLAGCGATGQKTTATPTSAVASTPKGSYHITVTAKAGSISHSMAVNLTVQ